MLKRTALSAFIGLAFGGTLLVSVLVFQKASKYSLNLSEMLSSFSKIGEPQKGIGSYKPPVDQTYSTLLGLNPPETKPVEPEGETKPVEPQGEQNLSSSQDSESLSHVVLDDNTIDRFVAYPTVRSELSIKDASVALNTNNRASKEEEVFTGVFVKLERH